MTRLTREQRTAEETLRQVVRFLAVDIGKASAAEHQRWYQLLRRLAPSSEFVEQAPDVRELLTQVQRDVTNGIRATFTGQRWTPAARPVLVATPQAGTKPVRWLHQWRWLANSERDLLVAGTADLVQRAGSALRACQRCHTLFLGRKRGVFCSVQCQQHEMDQRKLVRRKAARDQRGGPRRRQARVGQVGQVHIPPPTEPAHPDESREANYGGYRIELTSWLLPAPDDGTPSPGWCPLAWIDLSEDTRIRIEGQQPQPTRADADARALDLAHYRIDHLTEETPRRSPTRPKRAPKRGAR
jgi:hypothetical protein